MSRPMAQSSVAQRAQSSHSDHLKKLEQALAACQQVLNNMKADADTLTSESNLTQTVHNMQINYDRRLKELETENAELRSLTILR